MATPNWDPTSSPFAHYMGTNDGPSEPEIQSINELLEKPCSELRELDFHIEEIQKTLSALQDKRNRISNFIDKHRIVTSLIRRLPAEILSSIFDTCLPTNGIITFSRREAPSLISWVCRRWREIALVTPGLWANVHLAIPAKDPASHYLKAAIPRIIELRSEAFKEWMKRAKDPQLLSLSFYEPDATRALMGQQTIAVNFIKPLLSRIRSLNLNIYQLDTLNSGKLNLELRGSQMLRLQRLSAPYSDPMIEEDDSILCAPNLRDLRLTRVSTPGWHWIRLRWGKLTSLELAFKRDAGIAFKEDDLLSLIESCTALERFDLKLSPPSYRAHEERQEAHLNRRPLTRIVQSNVLRYLSLTEGQNVWVEVLNHLSFPALSELDLAFDDACPSPAEATIFREARASLRRLSIPANRYPSLDLIDLLQSLNGLDMLILRSPTTTWGRAVDSNEGLGFGDEVLKALTPRPGTQPMCPSLTSFLYHDIFRLPSWSSEAIFAFVKGRNGDSWASSTDSLSRKAESRILTPVKLRRVVLPTRECLKPQVRSALEEYVRNRLQLSFIAPSPVASLSAGAPVSRRIGKEYIMTWG